MININWTMVLYKMNYPVKPALALEDGCGSTQTALLVRCGKRLPHTIGCGATQEEPSLAVKSIAAR